MGNTKSAASIKEMVTGAGTRRHSKQSTTDLVKAPVVIEQEKQRGLSQRDIAFLITQTGLSQEEITSWYEKIFREHPDGRLDRAGFRKFYSRLRHETPERLNDMCDHIFRAFDVDGNGYVEFGEFLIGFAISSRGDLRSRLDYAFECYDLDSNGYITESEIEPVLRAMYTLLGVEHVDDHPPEKIAKELMQKLDTSNDGRVTKDEFVYFLMKEGIYGNMINPFH